MKNDFSSLDPQSDICELAQVSSLELYPDEIEFESAREYQLSAEYKRDWIKGKN